MGKALGAASKGKNSKRKSVKAPSSAASVDDASVLGGAKASSSGQKGAAAGAKALPPWAKTTVSKDLDNDKTPIPSLKSADKHLLMDIIARAPKITGTFQEPYPRKRENDYAFTIEIDKAKKHDALNLSRYYNGGQHIVAIIVPLNDVSEWPAWESFNAEEILQAHHGSDFERTFEVTTAFMADTLEMSHRNLQLLVAQGHAKRFGRGRYDLVGTFKAYLKALKDEFQGRGGKEYSAQRTRKLTASADREEVKLAQENDELGYIEDFESEQMDLALNVREAMERIPEEIAERLVKKPVHIIKRELAEEIKSVLEQLSIQAARPNGSNTGQAKTGRKKKAPKSGGRKKRSS